MILGAWWMVSVASADPACAPLEAAASGMVGVRVRIDGDLQVVPAEGDRVEVEACGADPRLRRRGDVLDVVGKGGGTIVVRLPASIGALTVYEREGAVATSVPARVAVVSSAGPVDVRGAAALRVAYHEGDVAVDDIAGDLVLDHVDGRVSGTVRGQVHADAVSGPVDVTAAGRSVTAR